MPRVQYDRILGLDRSREQIAAPQVSFLHLNNYIPSRVPYGLRPRGGSYEWTTTGAVFGIDGYKKQGASTLVPMTSIPIRHRYASSVSTFEKLNWATLAWDNITLGANTSFGVDGIADFAQIATVFVICAGRPAKLTDISAGSISRLGGPAPTTAPTTAVGAAGVLTGDYTWVYTFYDSTTGWESSPSPASVVTTLTADQGALSALETTVAKEGVDQKRIYRTISTGEEPYLLSGTIALATTTYNDNIADGSLGQAAPSSGDHDPPPTNSYVCVAHAGSIWVASGSELWYSLPYDGDLTTLEYFSPSRVFEYEQRITGLAVARSGNLLVFQPPGVGIEEIQGRSEATFEQVTLYADEGTNFPQSVSSYNDYVTWWGADGPVLLGPSGIVAGYGDEIREVCRSILLDEYNDAVYVWSAWVEGKAVYGLAMLDDSVSQWENVENELVGRWEDILLGNLETWEDV